MPADPAVAAARAELIAELQAMEIEAHRDGKPVTAHVIGQCVARLRDTHPADDYRDAGALTTEDAA